MRRLASELLDLVMIAVIVMMVAGDFIEDLLDSIEGDAVTDFELENMIFQEVEKFVRSHIIPFYLIMYSYDALATFTTGGATVGKLVMGLRIKTVPDAAVPTAKQFLIRSVVKTFSWAIGSVFLISAMFGRCPHDRIAKTQVVCVRT